MSILDKNFDGYNKIEIAIMRLKEFEPKDGYYLAFSGGKDSIVIYDIAVKSGVKFDAHMNLTGLDPYEVIKFIRENYPNVQMHKPEVSFFKLLEKKGLPTRQARWCCEALKETGGSGRTVITGIRWAESTRRQQRRLYEVCRTDGTKYFLHPIIDWTTKEVWEYIKLNNMPYCSLYKKGFTRIGCVLCPMQSLKSKRNDIQMFQKTATAIRHAADRYYEYAKHNPKRKNKVSAPVKNIGIGGLATNQVRKVLNV